MSGRPRVYTARVGYVGLDALDITRGTGRGSALAFAPSDAILAPALDARRRAKELRDHPLLYPDPVAMEADRIEAEAWARYAPAYLAEMRRSYREERDAWNHLLLCPLVTLCCYCADASRCHRTLLARDILPKLGCIYAGERPSQAGKALVDKLMDSVDEELALRAAGSGVNVP